MNIDIVLPRHAQYRPNQTAVVFKEQRLTYKQFNERVNRWAHALRGLGIGKGDKIATILPNCLPQLDTFWAAAKLGAVVVPLSPMLQGAGLSRLLNNSDAVLVLTTKAFSQQVEAIKTELTQVKHYVLTDAADVAGYHYYADLTANASSENPPAAGITGDDPINIIYSSGTTGLPKGIVHTHAIRAWYCTSFAVGYRMSPESVVLHTGSLVFNGAFLILMPAFFLGATFILHPKFDAEQLIETVAREQVTHMVMVPSQVIAMLNAPNFDPARMQSLEMINSVGAPLHLEHKQALDRALPGRFYELYGLTEGFMTILDKYDFAAKPNSVGVPLPFYEMRIMKDGQDVAVGEIGEIVGRSPIMMPGYYKRPDLTARAIIDGWLHSGDLGYVDEDGFLYLVDREKDMIISGGVNVYPRDIEEVIVQHPAVREAAVFGIPSPKWGETPLAAVILHQEGTISPAELRDWINQRVSARYQKVAQVVIKKEFPRSVAGKTLKRVMREPYWAELERKI